MKTKKSSTQHAKKLNIKIKDTSVQLNGKHLGVVSNQEKEQFIYEIEATVNRFTL